MILVTVGTHDQPFDRLIKAMDSLAAELDERVLIQTGASTYRPQHADHFDFTTSRRMLELTAESRIVVAHAAAGTIILTLGNNKPLVLVPRLQQFGEVIDDHQLQLANALHASERACSVHPLSPQLLREAIATAPQLQADSGSRTDLVAALRGQLGAWGKLQPTPNDRLAAGDA